MINVLRGTQVQMQVDWFNADKHPEFCRWLERAGQVASWADASAPPDEQDFPDLFVGVDPSLTGEGTDSDMPQAYWSQVVDAAAQAGPNPDRLHIIVRISPRCG